MIQLLFIIYYDAKDHLLCIKEQFKKYGIEVTTYPLFKYAYDVHDKISDYKENLNNFLKQLDPEIIFWWFIDVPIDVFKYIKEENNNKYFIMYNSDDPYNLNKDLFDKCKFFDLIMTPSYDSVYKYNIFSFKKNVLHVPFGFDSDANFQIINSSISKEKIKKYSCDISLYCYDFFVNRKMYSNQYIYIIDLINNISSYCKTNNKSFKIFGSYIIKEYFPELYAGEIKYKYINLLYNFSKINLSVHGNQNNNLTFNQHIFSILGSSGLLFVDRIKNMDKILTDNQNCIIMNQNNYVNQIDEIFKNYDTNPNYYDKIKTNARNLALNYSWEQFVKKIVLSYGKDNFNKKLYAMIYNRNESEDLLNYWINKGIENKEICYSFKIPSGFNYDEYIVNNKLSIRTIEYAYYHWYNYSKDMDYFKQKKSNDININNLGVTMDQYYKTCVLLSELKNARDKHDKLIELQIHCDKIPTIQINEIINSYLSSC